MDFKMTQYDKHLAFQTNPSAVFSLVGGFKPDANGFDHDPKIGIRVRELGAGRWSDLKP